MLSTYTNSSKVTPICPSCGCHDCSIIEEHTELGDRVAVLRIQCSRCQTFLRHARNHRHIEADIEDTIRIWNGRNEEKQDMSLLFL